MPQPFAAPWHAQLFALTVHLNEAGVFAWAHWAEAFGATLKRHGLQKELDGGELDGGDDYYAAWLETLEAVLAARGLAEAADLAALKTAWEQAYLRTPHGQAVQLG
jgi:nitrile hydratase accessory protein